MGLEANGSCEFLRIYQWKDHSDYHFPGYTQKLLGEDSLISLYSQVKNCSYSIFTLIAYGIAYVFSGAEKMIPGPFAFQKSRLGVGSTTRIMLHIWNVKIKSYIFNGPGKIKLHCQVSSVMATKTSYLHLERFKMENTEVKYAIFLYNWDIEATILRTPITEKELKIFISPARWCLIHLLAPTGNEKDGRKKTNFIKFKKRLF